MQVCPKCRYELPEARQDTEDCPRCGIVFARFDPDRATMAPMVRVSRPTQSRPPVLLIVLALAVVLVLILGWPRPRTEPPAPEMPEAVPSTAAQVAGETPAPESEPGRGLTAADLMSQPGLEDWGEVDPNRPPAALTPSQMADARAARSEVGFEVGVEALDPGSVEGMSALGAGPVDGVAAQDDELAWVGWYEGAGGYDQAQRQMAQMSPRPLVIYFHAEWCGYCARFEADFLPDPLLRRFLSDVFRVHVNPERSPADKALADRFGVRGYPSFFILRPGEQPAQARRVHPFWDQQAIPVSDFVAMAEEAAGAR